MEFFFFNAVPGLVFLAAGFWIGFEFRFSRGLRETHRLNRELRALRLDYEAAIRRAAEFYQ
jgi:hypothetical protein